MQPIIPNLWFDSQAEDAARYYVSVFRNAKLGPITHFSPEMAEAAEMPVGSVLTVTFDLMDQRFIALNGGPAFKLSEAVSFMIPCADQAELDHYWNALSEGGEIQPCGWVKDKFGLSWQVVPAFLQDALHDADRAKSDRVMAQIVKMKKLDFKPLEEAYAGAES